MKPVAPATHTLRLGIDLGGSKISAIVLDTAGKTRLHQRIASPQGSYTATLDCLVSLIRDIETDLGECCHIGLGTPGSLCPATGLMRNSNSTWLNGKPLLADLQQQLQRPLRIANDANCFALSEASDGAAAGASSVFGVIIGTGVGGGLVINGQLLPGHNALAGEWGHNRLADETDEIRCYCGRSGCIETWLSGPALVADHYRHNRKAEPDLTARDIAAGQLPGSQATLDRYVDRLAKALAAVINVVDPACIVLGGGLSNIQCLYEQVPQRWSRWIFADSVTTQLLPPQYGDDSGVRGAAWLWS